MSPTKDGLTCEQNVYAGHLYLLVHHPQAAGSHTEAPGAGGAVQPAHLEHGHHLRRDELWCHRPEGLTAAHRAGRRVLRPPGCYSARDSAAVDATTDIRVALHTTGTAIGLSDTAVAGHAIASGAVLVTGKGGEFERVPGLVLEDWVK